ncbi:hypothetical protein AB834_00910 [PVC group bacterium (ex Bugula neritina AB1)]|nr:hypothetical protein AB834_00910 [PVC group bacterium (ex Bugula neritina AB1)]
MITVKNISKSFGQQNLFDDASFHLNQGEKIGLIGLNGHGKSTLLKIITGEEESDSGEILLPKGYRLGFLPQHMVCKEETVLKEASQNLSSADGTWKVKKALSGLGFSEQDFERSPESFSHGYRMRIALVKLLISEPDLLLLDEPTNFLDIISIRWLKNFLKKWTGELFLISHDRKFMDDLITHVVAIQRQKIRKMKGSISQFQNQIEMEEEVYEKERLNAIKARQRQEEYIQKYRAKARRASQVQSKIKHLAKQEIKEKQHDIKNFKIKFQSKGFHTKYVGRLENLTFGYTKDRILINDLSMEILYGDKIAIIGENGSGKSTLLSMVNDQLNPCTGKVQWHPQVTLRAFNHKEIENLNPDLTVEETISEVLEETAFYTVRHICGAMMFTGDSVFKKVEVLSGGEKVRLVLAKLLAKKSNVLLLDEPTHHLDLPSCEALIDATRSFKGTVLFVTHDEYFLREVAQKLIVFQRDGVKIFEGGYDDFLAKVGWEEDFLQEGKDLKKVPLQNRKERRRDRAKDLHKRQKLINPLKKEIEKLESMIEQKEKQQKECQDNLIKASVEQDLDLIHESNQLLKKSEKDLDLYYDQLFELSEELKGIEEELEKL